MLATNTSTRSVTTRVLDGFDDPSFGRARWNEFVQSGQTDVVFLTWEFQRAWSETLIGSGKPLLIVAERDGRVVALAPFYAKNYEIAFIGTGFSEWLDLIGDTRDGEVVYELLAAARDHAPATAEFNLNPLPARNDRAAQLDEAAARLGLKRWLKRAPVPRIDIGIDPDAAAASTRRKSLVRHENFFRRSGSFEVEHLRDGAAIAVHLPTFFEQYNARWAGRRDSAGVFVQASSRAFVERLIELAANTGWLRFTRVLCDGRPIAFHLGFCYRGTYSWWRPCFDIALARQSPGEVLLRQILLAAINEGVRVFDFGIGDQPYKLRFATAIDKACWWGAY